jgi:hypothetical protein
MSWFHDTVRGNLGAGRHKVWRTAINVNLHISDPHPRIHRDGRGRVDNSLELWKGLR